jgi:hypothetical protein
MPNGKSSYSPEYIRELLLNVLSGDKKQSNEAMMAHFAKMGVDVKTMRVAAEFCEATMAKAPEWSGYHFGAATCEATLRSVADRLEEHLDQHGKPD